MTHQENKNILSIQLLRGIAAVLVVFCHSEQFVSAFLTVHMIKYTGQCFGNFGVDIFFVISGFIMAYICQGSFGVQGAIKRFISRRFVRIFPIYWLVSLFVLLVVIPSGLYVFSYPENQHFVVSAIKDPLYLLKSFALIPAYSMDGSRVAPLIGVAWTLIYEIFFYVIFSFLLLFQKKYYLSTLTLIFIISIAAQLLVIHSILLLYIPASVAHFLMAYGNDIILEFIYGCVIAELYLKRKILNVPLALMGILFSGTVFVLAYHIPQLHYYELHGIAKVFLFYHIKALGAGIPAALLLYSVLSLEYHGRLKISQFFIALGNASYSLYLTHFSVSLVFIIGILKCLNRYYSLSGDMCVLIVWLFSIMIGWYTYKYLEKPLIKLLNQQYFIKEWSAQNIR